MSTLQQRPNEHVETVVIGGGQAGLSAGYYLAKAGRPFIILEGGNRVGDAWRNRWDSLRLFTPARYDGLAGMPFPADPDAFPTKDEMADYLESYADRWDLPVRTGVRVQRLGKAGTKYRLTTTAGDVTADNVVIAMGHYQQPQVPPFAGDLDPGIVQLHSGDYRSPAQLRDGGVLLVGAGNSAAEIAMEVARTHTVWMSGRTVGHVPFRIAGFLGRTLLVRLVLRGLFHRVLTIKTPIGRKVRPKALTHGGPLIRTKPKDLAAAGVQRVGRITEIRNGLPMTDDDEPLPVANVIWCTGYTDGFDWLDLPVRGEHEPRHVGGVVPDFPGLYFVGLHFQTAMSSGMIHGVQRDAERIVGHLVRRTADVSHRGAALSATVAAWLPQRLQS